MSKNLRAWSCPPADPTPPSCPDRGPLPAPRSLPPIVGRVLPVVATSALCAMLVGCLAREEEFTYPNANVEGVVTLDGAPINSGIISFLSLDTANGQSVKTRIVRGRYIAEKVPLGKVLAVISAFKETGRMSAEGGQKFPETINLIPPKYQNGFELDVKWAMSTVDFKLTSQGAEPVPAPAEAVRPDAERRVRESELPAAPSQDAGPDAERRAPDPALGCSLLDPGAGAVGGRPEPAREGSRSPTTS